MDGPGQSLTIMDEKKPAAQRAPIRVLLLDDHIDNLILRSAILRKHGYDAIKAATIVRISDQQKVEEALRKCILETKHH